MSEGRRVCKSVFEHARVQLKKADLGPDQAWHSLWSL